MLTVHYLIDVGQGNISLSVIMSLNLTKAHTFLKILFDSSITKNLRRVILLNSSNFHLKVFSEIFCNLVENATYLSTALAGLLGKGKRLIHRFCKGNYTERRELLKKHFRKLYHILFLAKELILSLSDK